VAAVRRMRVNLFAKYDAVTATVQSRLKRRDKISPSPPKYDGMVKPHHRIFYSGKRFELERRLAGKRGRTATRRRFAPSSDGAKN